MTFISIDNGILYLVYTNEQRSLIFYNLIDNKKMNEIKNPHEYIIDNIRYFFDKINNRDIILSLCYGNLKIWNINLECILNINDIMLMSACIFNNINQSNIIYIINKTKPIYMIMKVYNLNGNLDREINLVPEFDLTDLPSKEFIDCYYDTQSSKNYILLCNTSTSFSFDYNNQKIYRKYKENFDSNYNQERNIIIKVEQNSVKLIESIREGRINIWDFHSGNFLKTIYIINNFKNDFFIYDKFSIYGICLWKENYLFIWCSNFMIKLVDLNEGKIVYKFKTHVSSVSIKVINHPKFGECLISQDDLGGGIQLWDIKKKFN